MVSCFDSTLCAGSDDGTGRCSLAPLPSPFLQNSILTDFGENGGFEGGNTTGCYSRFYGDLLVHASFTCDGAPSDECRQCLTDGFVRLEDVCPGRAGGTVRLDDCCVRYETAYDICT
ncbi:unnamed protein product [Linum trigynum]|uniref:Gnk2-homologous domain-containing protein n=1 Tax=Linum trigynum TaxID=586398 RepID=A0AAV2GIF8_9ROSI